MLYPCHDVSGYYPAGCSAAKYGKISGYTVPARSSSTTVGRFFEKL